MNDIIIRVVDMPESIRALTIRDPENDYNIYLNCRLSQERLLQAYMHELQHIRSGDFDSSESVDLIEIYAHRSGG